MLRVANRFLILTSVGLAVLVGFGVAWMGVRDRTFLLIFGLVVFDYLCLPYPVRQVNISPLYEQLSEADGDGAVLHIPFHQRNRTVHNLAAQTVHRRPIGDGYISTISPTAESAIREEPSLADLVGVPKLQRPIDSERLLELGFEWVVLHKERRESHRRALEGLIASGDVLEARRVRRLGGVTDEIFDEMWRQLIAHAGLPVLEDDKIAVFALKKRY